MFFQCFDISVGARGTYNIESEIQRNNEEQKGLSVDFFIPEFPNPMAPRLFRNEITSEGFGVGNRGPSVQSLIGDLVMLMV